MLLCIDVGNTQIFGGVYAGEELRVTFRRTSIIRASSDEFGTFFRTVLRENGVDPNEIDAAAVCSVVPDVVHSLRNCFRKYFRCEPFLLQPGAKTGLKIRYRNQSGFDQDGHLVFLVVEKTLKAAETLHQSFWWRRNKPVHESMRTQRTPNCPPRIPAE